jgi:2-oxoglutarate dehydrogenase E2 component (dihydrolipoamide succinyltransferase)
VGTQIHIKKDVNIAWRLLCQRQPDRTGGSKTPTCSIWPGLTKQVNDLASRARQNQLRPDEIQGGTFTLTNVGTFGNVMGTPIINQPR